jgi:hypothetical protein
MNQFSPSSSVISVSSDLVITAPTIYLQERFPSLKQEIENNNSMVFHYALNVQNVGLQMALQITIQTDYASWKGNGNLINSIR